MKFTQLPKDGASWQEPLRYKFSTESTEPENLKVEIRDETLQQTIATLNLYATTTGDIDIAPYLRDRLRLTPITSIRAILLAISPSAIAVSVVVNGVRSAVRHFFRSAHDYNHIGMLSYHAATRSVRRGDAIRLTLFAKANIMVTINYNSVVPTTPTQHSLLTKGMPAEIVIPTEQLRSTNSLEITILYDGTKTETVTYMIEAAYGTIPWVASRATRLATACDWATASAPRRLRELAQRCSGVWRASRDIVYALVMTHRRR